MTRYQFAFDNFDNTQCSADLFVRETNIWKQEDICPTPVDYSYVPTDSQQSLPRNIREKRRTTGKECKNRDPANRRRGCSTFNTHATIDVSHCKATNAYSPKNILKRQNLPCCLKPNFRANAINQVLRAGGRRKGGRANFKKTRDICCNQYRRQTRGVDALKNIGCPYAT